jgi:hypothetical protein
MRVLNFFLFAAPAVGFLLPAVPKTNMALQANQRNEVRQNSHHHLL